MWAVIEDSVVQIIMYFMELQNQYPCSKLTLMLAEVERWETQWGLWLELRKNMKPDPVSPSQNYSAKLAGDEGYQTIPLDPLLLSHSLSFGVPAHYRSRSLSFSLSPSLRSACLFYFIYVGFILSFHRWILSMWEERWPLTHQPYIHMVHNPYM